MRSVLFVGLLLSVGAFASADETLHIRSASRQYDLVVHVTTPGQSAQNDPSTATPGVITGPARISIFRKGAKAPFQVFAVPNVSFDKEAVSTSSKSIRKPRELYGDDPGIVFEDFNFDGRDDLAICDGENGGYGMPSYNVYLYDEKSDRFLKSKSLTNLTQGAYLGLFLVDAKARHLVAFQKDGAAWHEKQTYRVLHNVPALIEDEIDDQRNGPEVITTKRLIRGHWVKRVIRHKSAEAGE